MDLGKRERERLRALLRRAYWDKENVEAGTISREEVMGRIRREVPCPAPLTFSALLERFVWRLAPVVALLILGLLAFCSFSPLFDSGNGQDWFQLVREREELTLAQLFET